MTNRQTAAQLVREHLNTSIASIENLSIQQIAAAGRKSRGNESSARQVKDAAKKFIKPWLERMEKLVAAASKEAASKS